MIDVFFRRVGEVLATQSTAHWMKVFAPFDLPAAPVRQLEEHLQDPQALHNELFHEIDTPAGAMRAVRYPARYDGAAIPPGGRPPAVGEHAAEIRAGKAAP